MSDDYPSRTLDKIVIRVPDGMRDRIRDAAEANNRSMNAEIVSRLERSFQVVRQEFQTLPASDVAAHLRALADQVEAQNRDEG